MRDGVIDVRDGHPPTEPARADRSDHVSRRTGTSGLVTVLVVIGVAGIFAASSALIQAPWGVGLGAWIVTAALAATVSRLSTAAAGALLVTLMPTVAALRLGPVLQVEPRTMLIVLWAAQLLVVVAFLVRFRGRLVRPSLAGRARALWALIPGVVGIVLALGVALVPSSAVIAWAMRNDSANNVMFIRFLLEDLGVDPTVHPNPAYLIQGLVALGLSRDANTGEILYSYAAVWLATTILAATVLAGLVLSTVRGGRRAVLGGLAVGLFTYSWFVLGFSMTFGFANVPIALVLLGASLMVFAGDEHDVAPRLTYSILAAVLLLATWAPLAVVPVGLGLVAVWARGTRRILPRLLASRGTAWLAAGALALGAVYVVSVVLPDLRSDGGNLTQGGAFFALSPLPYVAASIALLLISFVGLVRSPSRRAGGHGGGPSVRASTFVVCGAVAVLAFVALAVRAGAVVWAYYPQKLSWILAIVSFALLVAASLNVSGPAVVRWLLPVGAAALVLLLATTVLDGPGLRGYVPALKVARGIEPGAEEDARRVIELVDASEPRVLWLYGSTAFDHLANSWLMASRADSVADPIRAFTATIAPTPDEVCRVLDQLGPEAVLMTTAENAPAVVRETCPDLDFAVEGSGAAAT